MNRPWNSPRNNPSEHAECVDPHAFAAQYRAAYSRLALMAAGLIGDHFAAEDVVQDAAIVAFQRRADFTPGTNFAAWMAEIVRRCALNYRRKANRRRTYATDAALLVSVEGRPALMSGLAEVTTRAGEVLEGQAAFDDELVRALKQLAPDARCCLLLRSVERLSYAEIAALMHIPEGTAMSHVHRSRTALRRALTREPAGAAAQPEAGQ